MGLGLPAPAALALAAGADVAGDRRGGAGLRRSAARASTCCPWPRASPSSGPTAGRSRTTTSAAWSRTTSAMARGGRPPGPLVLLADVRPLRRPPGAGQVVVYDCMDELANFAAAPAGLDEAEARLLGAGRRRLHGRAQPLRVEARAATRTSTASPRPSSPTTSPAPSTPAWPSPRTWPACPGRSWAITAWSTSGSITT